MRIHRTLSHKHIVRFEHSFENDAHVYIVLELCPNKVRRASSSGRREWMVSLVPRAPTFPFQTREQRVAHHQSSCRFLCSRWRTW